MDNKLESIAFEEYHKWHWNKFAIGKHEICIKAYDKLGNVKDKHMEIIIFNL